MIPTATYKASDCTIVCPTDAAPRQFLAYNLDM
jgi:hypothetical protein